LRNFFEAVLTYTKAEKINVVTHSMGVTLSRKVIKGGKGYDSFAGEYDLGESLKNKVDTFIGVAGGNFGLTDCYLTP